MRDRARIAHQHDLEGRKLHIAPERAAAVGKLLTGFFTEAPEGIGKSQQLALALATRCQLLRDYMVEELQRQEKDNAAGRLFGLFGVFKSQVFHELTLKEFADAFAQMLAYGLFLAKLNAGQETITLNNAREHVPSSFRLIRELVDFLTDLNKPEYAEIRWVVEEVLSIVNGLDLAAIHEDLSFRNRKAISRKIRAEDEEEHRLFERDPFIYFYEDFLRAYDKETRKSRGVYYTPPPIVNFIVRAVDDILKDSFKIEDGLADHKRVTVLDFACGTGTFLLETFEKVFENIGGASSGKAALVVREHLLKNLYGSEYLIAPYTIAHLKLSQYLRDKRHPLKDDERLQVFLTNTLEPVEPQKNLLLPEVSREVEAAQEVKDKPILVIMGNPPYSGHSRNNSAYVKSTIDAYKMVDGKPLGEKNPKWLQDDYVKFIRFAQMKMDAVDEGVVGIITNHSWLDNPTFRGMRASLMKTFQQIYVIDLHGNAKKKETAPDGSKDENVFDIEQGVAITLLVKRSDFDRGVWRFDSWGKRLEKYALLASHSITSLGLSACNSTAPAYRVTSPYEHESEYSALLSVNDLFGFRTMGIITKRDGLVIAHSNSDIWDRILTISQLATHEVAEHFKLPPDNDWNSNNAHSDVKSTGPSKDHVSRILYAPFDRRFTYYTGKTRGLMARPVWETMRHLANSNIAISLTRKIDIDAEWTHVLVVDGLMTHHAVSLKEGNYVFPLRIEEEAACEPPVRFDRYTPRTLTENLSPTFRDFLDARYNHHYEPEEILGYIYAVLHTPAYRRRYAEFLRMDFPRIPFPEAKTDFDALKALGWALVQVHLLRAKPGLKLARYHGKGGNDVEAVRYAPEEKAVHINKTQYFAPVPGEVWDFHIGGYQVLEKYLKSRKGRTLSLDEIDHVSHVADALAFTVSQMQAIDLAYAKAFPNRG